MISRDSPSVLVNPASDSTMPIDEKDVGWAYVYEVLYNDTKCEKKELDFTLAFNVCYPYGDHE